MLLNVDKCLLWRGTNRHAASCQSSEQDFKGQETEFLKSFWKEHKLLVDVKYLANQILRQMHKEPQTWQSHDSIKLKFISVRFCACMSCKMFCIASCVGFLLRELYWIQTPFQMLSFDLYNVTFLCFSLFCKVTGFGKMFVSSKCQRKDYFSFSFLWFCYVFIVQHVTALLGTAYLEKPHES